MIERRTQITGPTAAVRESHTDQSHAVRATYRQVVSRGFESAGAANLIAYQRTCGRAPALGDRGAVSRSVSTDAQPDRPAGLIAESDESLPEPTRRRCS